MKAHIPAQPLLDHIERYVQLTQEEQDLYLSRIRIRKYLKGQFVVQQRDVCPHENYVISGCLKTFHIDLEGNEHIMMFAVEDWWTGDLGSFITQAPSTYNVQCLENSELAQIHYLDLQELYQKIPKLERFYRLLIQNAYVASQKRITNNLSLPAKERYLQFRQQYPQIEQRVPQYMIASYLGITKEFLSKIRSQLIHEA